jgi:hypothetical protein
MLHLHDNPFRTYPFIKWYPILKKYLEEIWKWWDLPLPSFPYQPKISSSRKSKDNINICMFLPLLGMCDTMTILTWNPIQNKDTSFGLCLFTYSIPILCFRLRESRTLTLYDSLVYLWNVNTFNTYPI